MNAPDNATTADEGRPRNGVSPPDRAECIVVGGSAGAIEALLSIMPRLPSHYPLPVVAVVHLPPREKSLLVEIFVARCRLAVKEAEDKEPIVGGTLYFAPPNYHVLVESDLTLSLSSDEPVHYSRPAIDVLFESAADAYGSGLRAVVLTGASRDGSSGLKAVCERGGRAYVQRPDTAEASLMPETALQACPAAQVLDLAQIGKELERLAGPASLSS